MSASSSSLLTTTIALAACSVAVTSGTEIQLIPAGPFQTIDGRPGIQDGKPTGITCWQVDESRVAALVARINGRVNPLVIDYDHGTLLAKKTGQPAPAAGWFHQVEWRPGQGLYAVDVKWTANARAMIDAGEYKFISPVIAYDKTGRVTGLAMAALTNDAAIHGMDEVLMAAATMQFAALSQSTLPQEPYMEQLIEQLRWMLNLPVAATADEILAELTKLANQIKAAQGGTAAAHVNLVAAFGGMSDQIAALTAQAQTPDPAKFVPIDLLAATRDQVAALNNQVASLNAELGKGKLDAVITGALATGKLLPQHEAWARQLGGQNFAALTAFIDSAPPIAALAGTQTGGKPPAAGQGGQLTDDQIALCSAMGLSEADFLATLTAEAA